MRRLPLFGLVVLLAACGGGGGGGTTTAAKEKTSASAGGSTKLRTDANGCVSVPRPTSSLDPAKTYDVTLKTNKGSFTIRLDQKQSPHATASLVSLVDQGYLDHTTFHRIVPGFVIQGGDPSGTGTCGPGYSTVDTPPANASYTHGVVAMAKTGAEPAGTAGSQFFVVTADDAGLPPDYAIIGKVTDGLDVVDRIGKLGDATEQPTEKVEIEQATVETS
jgi:cyclophilin family peptidyl-prolyl cis-trans isomerase